MKRLLTVAALFALPLLASEAIPLLSIEPPADPRNHNLVLETVQKPPPPQDVQAELDQAQKDFETAKKMFIPWYTGPLITGSATNVDPGVGLIQPYLFIIDTYGEFTSNRKSVNISDIVTINPLFLFETGITKWLDVTVIYQAVINEQKGNWASNAGDLTTSFGLQFLRETPYKPAIRGTVTEIFPTGKYDKLDPSKASIDATGGGSFNTQLGLNISKVIWWLPTNPIAVRGNFNYIITTPTNVKGFNAYGGGFGTDGKVKPGNSWNIDIGVEYSFSQKVALALDIVYSYFNSSSFSGTKGVDAAGLPASVGGPSGDQFSLAPAIEYNVTDMQGFIGGVWFTVTGRNSSDFVGLVLSYYALF